MRLLATVLLLAASPVLANVTPFKTPSGNIECTIGESVDASDLRCEIFERSGSPAAPRAAGCDGAWGHIFVLLDTGATQMECGAPGPRNTAPGVDVAAYGQDADWGGISCSSSARGLECRNADGAGFFLSRARQTIFAGRAQGGRAEEWTPTSSTAMAITGPVTIADDEIVFGNGEALPLRAIAPDLYAVETSEDPILLNGNSLCGPRAPTYLAARRQGETLYLLVFDEPERPSVSGDPLSQSGSCALYVYERAGG